MQVSVQSVVMKQRVRRDLGNLDSLMASMRKYGQLNPITITSKYELIAGHRRLESAKRLGWYTVEAVVVDHDSAVEKLEMELEENVFRKDLTPEELRDGYTRLEKLRRPGFLRRVLQFFRDLFDRVFRRGKFSRESSEYETNEQGGNYEDAQT